MDSGAHFHRCDLQIHSPRDTNWGGLRPIADADRRAYADEFVRTCRARGIDAVAITDHHDLAFVPYIRDAALHEVNDEGEMIPEEARLTVFPGMELTLGVPCQALLILDADFPGDLRSNIPTILSIESNDPGEASHAATTRLEHLRTIAELCELLDRQDYLVNHYIVLPHVKDGGHGTLLRSGFAAEYKDMPCVGGYVDGTLATMGEGAQTILAGKNREYGFKALGVFQTSDARTRDFQALGTASSWVKWAVPTAEALRQACLAKRTRIYNDKPLLPTVVITSVDVSNSRFMGPINLALNPQLNCLIGGRGTGKSTILEYLRWTLCDQPPPVDVADDVPNFQSKRASLIANTLLPLEAVLTVTFLLNNVPHVVRRYANSGQLRIKVDADEFQDCDEEDVCRLLPIQAYSQKQLSEVSVRQEELARLIRAPIAKELADLKLREDELKSELRTQYSRIWSKRLLERQLERERLELQSLTQQVETLRKQLSGLSEEDQGTISAHASIAQEELFVGAITQGMESLRNSVKEGLSDIALLPQYDDVQEKYPNRALLKQVRAAYMRAIGESSDTLTRLLEQLKEGGELAKDLANNMAPWNAKQAAHLREYEAAKLRATTHEEILKEITTLEGRIRELGNKLNEKEQTVVRFGTPEKPYNTAREAWTAIYRQRADLLTEKCEALTEQSGDSVRASLRRGSGLARVQERLQGVLTGTRIRARKVEGLCDAIRQSPDAVATWLVVVSEFELLAQLNLGEEPDARPPETPTLRGVGFTEADCLKVAERLSIEEWIELSLVELEDETEIEYRQREGEYIDFADASAGQQATALLKILLNQEGPPLIVDQPEEDLDNQVILEIVEDIWQAKSKRQLVFSSHNANVVVNGDADQVVVCDYRTAGDQSGGYVKCSGAIDMDRLRDEITTVMEGGREAFRLRKEKYGF